ncbi:hypothetical protein F503_02498 [Ophiostoma piceae UAMH 11346]|uniref:Uncharacterized protein n=1 Tax=Ophiostoma piceae (strain UAMH 11346) TaxID=1262450 RepID=S3CZI1_OPHP1|nr:hypothetical protein F503_02498 [Ophiostoma piceae UAMH 11346]
MYPSCFQFPSVTSYLLELFIGLSLRSFLSVIIFLLTAVAVASPGYYFGFPPQYYLFTLPIPFSLHHALDFGDGQGDADVCRAGCFVWRGAGGVGNCAHMAHVQLPQGGRGCQGRRVKT